MLAPGHQLRKSINRTKKTIIGAPWAWSFLKIWEWALDFIILELLKHLPVGLLICVDFFFSITLCVERHFQTKHKGHSRKLQVPNMKLDKVSRKPMFTNLKIVPECYLLTLKHPWSLTGGNPYRKGCSGHKSHRAENPKQVDFKIFITDLTYRGLERHPS